ncbi:MAG: Uma2 family endonuclease [Planctomycetes bacterium]|nr:Uma2 family endonuclease [Planctomycetota bacterium]
MPSIVSASGAGGDEGGPRRFTLEEYHKLIQLGILTEGDNVELLEGSLVAQLPRGVAHDYAATVLAAELRSLVPEAFVLSPRCALTLPPDSEPEPDHSVARGPHALFRHRHPGPADTALVIEVAASSLARDRIDKARVYARAGLPVYWIVNVIDKQIEVFTRPSGPCDAPAYAQRDVFAVGASVPVVLDGDTVGAIAVADVMG